MIGPTIGRVGGAGRCPTIRAGIVSPAGVQIGVYHHKSTPDDHFTAGPDCRVTDSGIGRVVGADGCPTIRAGIVSPASVERIKVISSAPHDHFTAGPHCRVTGSASGRVDGAGGCPTIRARDCIFRRCSKPTLLVHIRPKQSFHCPSTLPCDSIEQSGALVVLVAVQLSVLGLYLPPVFEDRKMATGTPPQTIISLPVQTAV